MTTLTVGAKGTRGRAECRGCMTAIDWLYDTLQAGPLSAQEVRESATCVGLSQTQLRSAARDLAVEYTRTPEGALWGLPATPRHRPCSSDPGRRAR